MPVQKFTLPLSIPPDAQIKVVANQTVKDGDLLAVKPAPHVEFNLAKKLNLKPPKVEKLLQKKVGDVVESGEILIEKKNFFSAHKIISHVSGQVSSYQEGSIYLKINQPDIEIFSPVAGQVKLIENHVISIDTPVETLDAHWCWGPLVWGNIQIAGDRQNPPEIETVKGSYTGQIIVISGPLTKALWHKYIALDAKGFICSQVPDDFDQWSLEPDSVHTNQAMVVIDNGKSSAFASDQWKWFNDRVGQVAILSPEDKKVHIAKS